MAEFNRNQIWYIPRAGITVAEKFRSKTISLLELDGLFASEMMDAPLLGQLMLRLARILRTCFKKDPLLARGVEMTSWDF